MKIVNLVVGFTPYQALFAESFINDLEGDTYCFFSKSYPKNLKNVKKIILFKSKFASLILYSCMVWRWYLQGYKINFYFPHLSHIATNYLALSGKCETLNVYEEGIANYYDAVREEWRLGLPKEIFSYLVGLPYKRYSGHLAGMDVCKIESIFAARTEQLVSKDQFGSLIKKDLILNLDDKIRSPNKILFLDQPIKISHEIKKKYVEKWLKDFCLGKDVYYKPHHECSSLYNGMATLDDHFNSIPAENLIVKFNFGVVVSFNSSALINISRLFPEVKCFYLDLCPKMISVDGVSVDMFSFLETHGVRPYLELSSRQ